MLIRALLLALALGAAPAAALDLFPRHDVTAQFATHDGKPMANAEVRVFSPDNPGQPVLTGHTDADGKFEFPADRDGLWSAEARNGAEVARATVRVGGPEPNKPEEPLSPYWLIGGLLLLLVMAVALRILRARARRRAPRPPV